MHTTVLTGDQSRFVVLAKAIAQVVCSAPLSPSTGQPVAKAKMQPLERGYRIQVDTLSDDSSLVVDMPHVSSDTVAKSCLAYIETRLASSGFAKLA